MTITKVTIIQGRGADLVSLHTELPGPFPKVTNETLCLDFRAEYMTGIDYVVDTLGLDPRLIEVIRREPFTPNFSGRKNA